MSKLLKLEEIWTPTDISWGDPWPKHTIMQNLILWNKYNRKKIRKAHYLICTEEFMYKRALFIYALIKMYSLVFSPHIWEWTGMFET